jgi:capsular exopolysaccharide synthesis family protein
VEQIESGQSQQQLASLRDYLGVVRRRKWIVLQAVVLVPIAAFLYTVRQEPLYQASTEVLLSRQNLALTLTGTSDPLVSQAPERLLQTQARLAMAPSVATRVAARVKTRNAGWILGHTTVEPQQNADILVFKAFDAEPAAAVAMANALGIEYVRYRRRLDTSSLAGARKKVEAQIASLERDGRGETDVYANLVEKAQQLETIEALQTSNASVIRSARVARKIAPLPKRNTILGLGIGIVLGIALAFLREAVDTRVRTTDEIERRLGLPLLGRLPAPPRELEREGELVMMSAPRSSSAETYRILRTNFEFFNVDHGARVVMVTSSVGREGKSTTIANLGVALAAAGHRVALIDLDLRRPMLRRFFGVEGTAINDVLQGRAELQMVEIEEGERAGRIEVLTARPLRSETSDFLAGDQLDGILRELRERSDFVLVDAPPLLLVGDAIQLAAKVDAVIVVARLNVVRRQMLAELRRALDAVPASKIGFVVTGAELEHDYSYAYSAYYQYGRVGAGGTGR